LSPKENYSMSEKEENEGVKRSSAIGLGIKYGILVAILYFAAKWLGWV